MKTKLLFAAILMFQHTYAQTFQRLYGNSGTEIGGSIAVEANGDFVVASNTDFYGQGLNDIMLTKTDSAGNLAWVKTYGGSADDVVSQMRKTADGGYIIVATTESFGVAQREIYVIKVNASGDTTWTRTYGGSGNEYGRAITQAANLDYAICGVTNSYGAGMNDMLLIRTDTSGNTLWTKTYGGSSNDWGYAIQATNDNGFILAGRTMSYGAGNIDIYLVKTDSNGDTLWTKTYGGVNSDRANAVIQTSDDGYLIGGYTISWGAGDYDLFLIKTNSAGVVLWSKTYGGSATDQCTSIIQTADGGYAVAGYTNSFGSNEAWLLKIDFTGTEEWSKYYGASYGDYAYDVRQTSDGGYVLGTKFGLGISTFDMCIIKTDDTGQSGCNETSQSITEGSVIVTVKTGGEVGSGITEMNTTTSVGNPIPPDSIICPTVGIEQLTIGNGQITIHPNPTDGKFQIQSSKFKVEKIEIYDLFGRLLLRSNEPEIDISNYPAGLYIWSVGTARGKLLKQ